MKRKARFKIMRLFGEVWYLHDRRDNTITQCSSWENAVARMRVRVRIEAIRERFV